MEVNLLNQYLIDRIQDSEGKTIFNNDKRKCINCDQISYLGNPNIQVLKNNYKEDFSHLKHAYQMTSILEGAVQRGTG